MKDGLDAADFSFFDLEQLGKLPGPIDLFMIEKAECEDDSAFSIHGHKTPVADSRHDVPELSGLKLLFAIRLGGLHAVFKAVAVIGKGVISFRVISLQPCEIIVGGVDHLFPGRPLVLGDDLREHFVRSTHFIDSLSGWREFGGATIILRAGSLINREDRFQADNRPGSCLRDLKCAILFSRVESEFPGE